MTNTWRFILAAALAVGPGAAAEPANGQDPPGQVGVDQPAGVSASDRSTERDTTDTLGGAGRTEVIEGERSRSSARVSESEGRGEVQPGAEARASFENAPGSGSRADEDTASGAHAPDDASESTSLGADTGHGTGTEPVAPPVR